ncbi:hypothetical protein GBAR_LOCUS27691, partial [Geodia barretti]
RGCFSKSCVDLLPITPNLLSETRLSNKTRAFSQY